MKKFLIFITGFITASAISFAVIRKILKLIIEVLADLDILIYFKEGLLMTLGKAMGVPDMSFKPYGARRRDCTYSYARYNRERKEKQDESRKEQEV